MSLNRYTALTAAHVRDVLSDLGMDVAAADDVTLYSALLIAVRSMAADGDHNDQPTSEVDAIVRRLSLGWFRTPLPYLPQSRFALNDLSPDAIEVSSTFVGFADKPSGAFWTSSFLPDGTSAWAGVEEVVGTGSCRELWEVRLDLDAARVLAIASNDDYIALVRRFPLERRHRLTVDWAAAADEYDAVHLTAAGLADTHGAVVVCHGRTIALRGWDAECTAWLRFPRGRPTIVTRRP